MTDELGRTGATLEVDSELTQNIEALVEAGQQGMVLNLLADLHPADIAQLISHLPFDEAETLFHWLPTELAGDVVVELDDEFRAELLEEAPQKRLVALLDELDTDDAADILADLPDEVAQQVLPTLEDAEDLQELLGYDEESAGGIMAREYVAVQPHWTVEEVVEEVRRNVEIVEQVYLVYVVDEAHHLQGIASLKRLLLSKPDTPVAEIMETDIVEVVADVDQEEVARIMERYDLISLPVVDHDRRLLGRITIDDIVDVIREEAEEDIQRLSGVSGDEEPTYSVWRISRGRLPWLFVGLFGAILSAGVILAFEPALEEAAVLASFIPIVMAMAGNAGIQSSAIAVQGLASGDVWTSDMLSRIGKELVVSLVNGLALALALALCVTLFMPLLKTDMSAHEAFLLASTASLSLLCVIVLATTIGAAVPLLLDRMQIDPAMATGPFITTSNDILGLAVYFLMAKLIFL